MKTQILTRSKWIDDLSEEEMKVLKHAHELDEKLKSKKYNSAPKIGLLDSIVDRDIQRSRFIDEQHRDIIECSKARQLYEIDGFRNIVESIPEKAKKVVKRKLVL
jgi:hypothetical protein